MKRYVFFALFALFAGGSALSADAATEVIFEAPSVGPATLILPVGYAWDSSLTMALDGVYNAHPVGYAHNDSRLFLPERLDGAVQGLAVAGPSFPVVAFIDADGDGFAEATVEIAEVKHE